MPAEGTPSWLWVPALGAVGEPVDFGEEDLHYLVRVCRARAGERVIATDGRGGVATLSLEAGEPGLRGRIESVERRDRNRDAWILCGAPERGRADWLVEKLAELGVAVFQPVDCVRGSWERVRPGRWERLAIAALRQSRSPFLMEVRAPVGLGSAVGLVPGGGSRWLADPSGPRGLSSAAAGSPGVGAVGPAAGFEDEEWALLKVSGFEPIGLSWNRLRTETAALAWASWWASG